MKQIIDALEKKPCNKKELLTILRDLFPKKHEEALRKKCERSLNKLRTLGLVEEHNGVYHWYFYLNIYEGHEDRNAKLLHSKRLVPAMKRIAGIYAHPNLTGQPIEFESQEEALIRDACAEKHLSAYEIIWPRFGELERKKETAEKEKDKFNLYLTQKLRTAFGGKLVNSSKGNRSKSYVKDNIPSLVYSQILSNQQPLPLEVTDDGEIWLDGLLIAKDKGLYSKVKRFIEKETTDESNIATAFQIRKIGNETFEDQLKLQHEVQKLIMRIECGEPLLGSCETCPKIYIKTDLKKET